MVSIVSTKTDAVNLMLLAIGRDKIVSYPSTNQSLDEKAAGEMIEWVNRTRQTERDWKFNYEEKLTKTLNASKQVDYGASCSVVRVVRHYSQPAQALSQTFPDIELRKNGTNWMLYDLVNHGFTFITAPVVNETSLRDFEETPEAFRQWVGCEALVLFLRSRKGEPTVIQQWMREAETRKLSCENDLLYKGSTRLTKSVSNAPTMMDNPDVRKCSMFGRPRLYL